MSTQDAIPGYVAGTWVIDAAHSEACFEVRQFGISTVHGSFDDFEGTIVTAENPLDSSVNASLKTASVNTKNKRRDKHLRDDDFLKVETYPTITFNSTGVRVDGDDVFIEGDLTIRDVTKRVTLNMNLNSADVDGSADGKPPAQFLATTEIIRNDYGVHGGFAGAVIANQIKITLKIAANKQE